MLSFQASYIFNTAQWMQVNAFIWDEDIDNNGSRIFRRWTVRLKKQKTEPN